MMFLLPGEKLVVAYSSDFVWAFLCRGCHLVKSAHITKCKVAVELRLTLPKNLFKKLVLSVTNIILQTVLHYSPMQNPLKINGKLCSRKALQ